MGSTDKSSSNNIPHPRRHSAMLGTASFDLSSTNTFTFGPVSYSSVAGNYNKVEPCDDMFNSDKRSAHNALERQRREGLNTKFQQLAHALPGLQNVRRPSKSMIVAKSLEFVTKSVQRDASYQNKIRQLRKEHDTLRKHTERSQQQLRKRMNAEEVTNVSKGKPNTEPDIHRSPILQPTTKRHKSRSSPPLPSTISSSKVMTSKATSISTSTAPVKKGSTLHKFVHHHIPCSDNDVKTNVGGSSTEKRSPNKMEGQLSSTRSTNENNTSNSILKRSAKVSEPITSTVISTSIGNTDMLVTVPPCQQERPHQHSHQHTHLDSSMSSPMDAVLTTYPIHDHHHHHQSWPPLDLSALQPPQAMTCLSPQDDPYYSPDTLHQLLQGTHSSSSSSSSSEPPSVHSFIVNSQAQRYSAPSSLMPANLTTLPSNTTFAPSTTPFDSSHLSTYTMPYPIMYPQRTLSTPESSTLSYFWK
ncbi:uncharacterized protein BX664DRAFT_354674 [Halteromyces radiatus]|uniref:uncharacterized protein n=1 Tax=Halteromyces radiatus TaxID=101107 RepID=UPI00222029CB|nr:uncharacterized protein BX664DRAFT_354674 [Halteromyces radiatus]KAI8099210.1 hypothetical protein BX664DRAFT_354674 [Halteromyces radiatus]